MHKFRNGDKVSYKREIVIVAQVYPCEDDCSIFIPSLGYERNVLVSNLTAVALEDFSKGALYEWNSALFESVPSKYSRLREIFEKKEEVKGKGMGSILLGGVGAASSYESVDDYRKTMGAGLKSKVMSLKPKRHNIAFDL